MPVPFRLTVWGLPGALSVMLSVPVRAPVPVGAKVTLIVQLLPAAREGPPPLVSLKSPLEVMLVMVKAATPLFVSVTVCAALVVPTIWLLKVRLVGASTTSGPVITLCVRGAPE
jgi:hypothetical protein